MEKRFTIHGGELAFIKSQVSLRELLRRKPKYIPIVSRGHSGKPGKVSMLCLKGKCSNCYVANCPHECHKMGQ